MHRSGLEYQASVFNNNNNRLYFRFVANFRQSSTNFSMTAPGAMNNHIQAKSVCPARESNPRPSAFRADALTTTLRGWDDSTRRNFVTQLVTVLLEHPRACTMGTTPAAANGS